MKSPETDSLTVQQPDVPVKGPNTPDPMNYQPAPASISDIRRELDWLGVQQLGDTFDHDYQRLLLELLSHQDLKSYVRGFQESDLRGFIELLDNVGSLAYTPTVFT